MYILLIIIGIIGLGGLVFIISSKLHSLSLIDVEKATPKSKKVKEAIIASRFKRILDEKSQKSKTFFKNFSENFKHHFDKTVDKLMQLEAKSSEVLNTKVDNLNSAPVKEKSKLAELLEEAQKLSKEADWKLAEGKYIEAIKLDQKNVEAYMGLGRLYAGNNKTNEARQIFEFLLKLKVESPELYLDIANLAWEENNLDEAKIYYLKALSVDGTRAIARINLGLIFTELGDKVSAAQQFKAALELDNKNPRYLDLLVESSIQIGEEELAAHALNSLEQANPENEKIKEFKKRIRKMGSQKVYT
ncbi:MAG: tetratricopeptide repeat protein [Patescibacteria group bacterium]